MGAYRNWDLSWKSFKDKMIIFYSLFKARSQARSSLKVFLCLQVDANFLLRLYEGKRLVHTEHIANR